MISQNKTKVLIFSRINLLVEKQISANLSVGRRDKKEEVYHLPVSYNTIKKNQTLGSFLVEEEEEENPDPE